MNIDLATELKSLTTSIEVKKKEMDRLEGIIIKATSGDEEEDDEETRYEIKRLSKVLDKYSKALKSEGINSESPADATSEYFEKLYKRSQRLKEKRDTLEEQVPEMLSEYKKRRAALKKKKNDSIESYQSQVDTLSSLRRKLKKLRFHLKPFCVHFDVNFGKKSSIHPYYCNKIQEKINEMVDQRKKFLRKLKKDIEVVSNNIQEEEKRQQDLSTSLNQAQKNYQESVEKKRIADQRVADKLLSYNIIQQKIDDHRELITLTLDPVLALKKDFVQQSDEFMKKFDDWNNKIKNYKFKKFEKKPIPQEDFKRLVTSTVVRPKGINSYAEVRNVAFDTIDPREFRLFLVPEGNLLKWYLNDVRQFEKDSKTQKEECERVRIAMENALSKAKMLANIFARSGLGKPK